MLKKIRTFFRRGWAVQLPSSSSSYDLLVGKLERNEPFAFSRWGDGEWEAVLGGKNENEANCDGHQYFASLGEGLQLILRSNPSYFLGMQKLAYHKLLGREIDAFLKDCDINVRWLNADAFHDASRDGTIQRFFDNLSSRKVLLVGPSHLANVRVFAFDFCEVPAKNCWLQRDEVLASIKKRIDKDHPEVILFCAGMTSNWFVDQLGPLYPGFLIDVGSLLDPYGGVNSRNYHKKLAIAKQ